jgi:nucleoid-associated protein YgaU
MRRYDNSEIIGNHYGTAEKVALIRKNIKNGNISYTEITLAENDRLDILAGKYYGDGKLYWVIGAASNIGYCLQVPPGTIIFIPKLSDLVKYIT